MDELTRILRPRLPSPVTELHDDRLERNGVRLLLKRDDLIHPDLPGNKWRKLKYNLDEARSQRQRALLTFGGAHSNHIRAVAAAGRALGLASHGLIRGQADRPPTPTLEFAAANGMRLSYLDRVTYRRKHDPEFVSRLRDRYGEFYLIPEGGSNSLALKGCAELPAEVTEEYDLLCCPCGTGGTLAGIAAGLPQGKRALGFSVLRGDFLSGEVERLQREAFGRVSGNWTVDDEYHFGGFARFKPPLLEFIEDFQARHGIELDHVYLGKMLFGVFHRAAIGGIPSGSTVLAVKTG